jgi:CRP-like cAMP-binding protein
MTMSDSGSMHGHHGFRGHHGHRRKRRSGGTRPPEEIVVFTLGQGKTIGDEMLTTNETMSKETIKALTKLDVFALNKNDYDKFMKEIRSSERREVFTLLRDCFLFEGWSRAKLERLTNLCKKKVFDAGEYLFRQGAVPDFLFLLLSGELQLIKEIEFVLKNSLPVGPSMWEDRTRTMTKHLALKTITQRGAYLGEVSIIHDSTRTTSCVAKTRSVVLSIDKDVFLNMVDSDKIVQLNSRIEFTDMSLLEKFYHVKGGPESYIQTRDAVFYPNRTRSMFKKPDSRPATSTSPVSPTGAGMKIGRGRPRSPSSRKEEVQMLTMREKQEHEKALEKTLQAKKRMSALQQFTGQSDMNLNSSAEDYVAGPVSVHDNGRISCCSTYIRVFVRI